MLQNATCLLKEMDANHQRVAYLVSMLESCLLLALTRQIPPPRTARHQHPWNWRALNLSILSVSKLGQVSHGAPNALIIFLAFLWIFPLNLYLSCTGAFRIGHSTPDVASPVLSSGEGSPTLIFWQCFFSCSLGFCWPFSPQRCYCWPMVRLLSNRNPRSFSEELLSRQLALSAPSMYQCLGSFLPGWRILNFLFLSFRRFFSDKFSRLLRSLWWHYNPLVYQPFLPVLYQLQKLVDCTLRPSLQVINADVKQLWS